MTLAKVPKRFKTFEKEQARPTKQMKGVAANHGMVHLINLMGDNITYVETGVSKGVSLASIIQRCPNIKFAYGVDFYRAHIDTFERPEYQIFTKEEIEYSYTRAKTRILESGHKDKVTLILEHTDQAVRYFVDHSIDFLFLDHYLNGKDVEIACEYWYNKVRNGGCFAGHDYVYPGVSENINKFREKYNITSPMSVHGAEWVWIKEEDICTSLRIF